MFRRFLMPSSSGSPCVLRNVREPLHSPDNLVHLLFAELSILEAENTTCIRNVGYHWPRDSLSKRRLSTTPWQHHSKRPLSRTPWQRHSKRRLSKNTWHNPIINVGYQDPVTAPFETSVVKYPWHSAFRNVVYQSPCDTAPFETSVIKDLVSQRHSKRRLSKIPDIAPFETSVIIDPVTQRLSKRRLSKIRDTAPFETSVIKDPVTQRHSKRRLWKTLWQSAIRNVGYQRPLTAPFETSVITDPVTHRHSPKTLHLKADTHSMPCPCRAAKGLECVFPIWFTQCGRVWFTLAMLRPCHALAMPFFSRPRHRTAVERGHVGYLPAFGFFWLPRGVPRRLLSEAYQSSSQWSIPTTVKSGSSTLQIRWSV